MFETLRQNLVAFDKYAVENFHSILRKRTKETDTAEEISFKAREIDACKHELHSSGKEIYNFHCRTERFKGSPIVFAITKYNERID